MTVFTAPHWGNRKIGVEVNHKENSILFTFPDEGNREYYHIHISEWFEDYKNTHPGRNWIEHMEEKVWFTSDIRKFINSSLKLVDSGKKLPHDEITEKDLRLKQKAKENGGFLSVKDIMGEDED